MTPATELLRDREFRGIRIALVARLIVIAIALPIDQTLAVASQVGQVNSLIGLGAGFGVIALLLLTLQVTRSTVIIGIAAVIADMALMSGILAGWWDSIGGTAVPTSLMFKSAMGSLMAVFIVLNALTLRPLYPVLATFGMAAIYIAVALLAVRDPQSTWTEDYLTAYVGSAVSLPQIAGEFAVLLFIGGLVTAMTLISRRLLLGGVRLERANAQLGRYFSPSVRDQISDAGDDFLRPGGQVQDIAVLFCDIRDFTRLSESWLPDELMEFLSDYQSRMVDAVFEHGGTLDKFIGDAIMATFGTPVARPEATRDALDAAIAMRSALAELNRERAAAGKPEVQHGIGIHCGPAVVGNVGTRDRLEYTVMGDTVNVAAFVADYCKDTHEDLLVSGAVRAQLTGDLGLRELNPIEVKGRREPVQIFAVDAGAHDVSAGNVAPDFGREG